MRPGRSVRPSRSTVAGSTASPPGPGPGSTRVIWWPWISTVTLRIGSAPVPSISVAPFSNIITSETHCLAGSPGVAAGAHHARRAIDVHALEAPVVPVPRVDDVELDASIRNILAQLFVDVGFDHLAVQHRGAEAGPVDGFLDVHPEVEDVGGVLEDVWYQADARRTRRQDRLVVLEHDVRCDVAGGAVAWTWHRAQEVGAPGADADALYKEPARPRQRHARMEDGGHVACAVNHGHVVAPGRDRGRQLEPRRRHLHELEADACVVFGQDRLERKRVSVGVVLL